MDMDLLVNAMPSKYTIQNPVTKNTVNTCILTQESLRKDIDVYIHQIRVKGNKNLEKYIRWYDTDVKR